MFSLLPGSKPSPCFFFLVSSGVVITVRLLLYLSWSGGHRSLDLSKCDVCAHADVPCIDMLMEFMYVNACACARARLNDPCQPDGRGVRQQGSCDLQFH